MEKQKLSLHQELSYAHWSAKLAFNFPYVGWLLTLIAWLIWLGTALWFFETEVKSLTQHSGEHGFAKTYFSYLIGVVVLLAVSYATSYAVFFVYSLFDKDNESRKYFVKHFYKKH